MIIILNNNLEKLELKDIDDIINEIDELYKRVNKLPLFLKIFIFVYMVLSLLLILSHIYNSKFFWYLIIVWFISTLIVIRWLYIARDKKIKAEIKDFNEEKKIEINREKDWLKKVNLILKEIVIKKYIILDRKSYEILKKELKEKKDEIENKYEKFIDRFVFIVFIGILFQITNAWWGGFFSSGDRKEYFNGTIIYIVFIIMVSIPIGQILYGFSKFYELKIGRSIRAKEILKYLKDNSKIKSTSYIENQIKYEFYELTIKYNWDSSKIKEIIKMMDGFLEQYLYTIQNNYGYKSIRKAFRNINIESIELELILISLYKTKYKIVVQKYVESYYKNYKKVPIVFEEIYNDLELA